MRGRLPHHKSMSPASAAFVAEVDRRFRDDARRVVEVWAQQSRHVDFGVMWSAVLLSAWRRGLEWSKFASEDHVRNWLFHMLRLAAKWGHAAGCERDARLREKPLRYSMSARASSDTDGIDARFIAVNAALASMSEHRRMCFELREVAEWTLAEVAAELGFKRPSLVCYHLDKAKAELRGRLDGTYKPERASSFGKVGGYVRSGNVARTPDGGASRLCPRRRKAS